MYRWISVCGGWQFFAGDKETPFVFQSMVTAWKWESSPEGVQAKLDYPIAIKQSET